MRRAGSVAAAAVLALAGCGGSGRLSGDQLRSRATALCAAAGRQTDRIPTPSSPAGGASFLKRGISVLEPELKRLKTLRPTDDLAQVYATGVCRRRFESSIPAPIR